MTVDYIPFTELLSDIIDNRGRTCPTSTAGFPLIATNCIRNDLLYPVFENIRYVSKETIETWFRGHPEPGDIIFVNKGTPGRVCMVPDPVSFCIAQDMVAIRADQKKIYPKYLFAVLRSSEVQTQIENMHVGTLIPHFKKVDFDKLLIPVPDKKTQEIIGNNYFTLSHKIELNLQMNKTLEAMARAIFQLWFVDFDPVRAKAEGRQPAGMDAETAALFPDGFDEVDGRDVPKGWRVETLGNVVGMTTGRSYTSDELQESTTALVTLKSFQRGGGYRQDGLKPFTGKYKPEQVIQPGELVISFTDVTQAAEVIGKPALVSANPDFQTLVASLDVGIIRPKDDRVNVPFLYLLLRNDNYQSHIYGYCSGTTVLHLNKSGVPEYEFTCPDPKIMKRFLKISKPIFDQIQINIEQSRTLAQIRDELLPKVMSGELRVDNIDNNSS